MATQVTAGNLRGFSSVYVLFSSSLPFTLSLPFLPSNNLITFYSLAGLVGLVDWDD